MNMNFEINKIVWAKLGKSPHWPARVVQPENFPNIQPPKTCKNPNNIRLVHFFESNNLAWVNIRYLTDFSENRQKFKSKKSISLKRAVSQANAEVDWNNEIQACTEYNPTDEDADEKTECKRFRRSESVEASEENNSTAAEQTHDEQPPKSTSQCSTEPPKKYGFLGLENFSCYLAVNMCKAGYDVTVWSYIPMLCARIVSAGAVQAKCIKDLVDNCDVIFSCWSDSEKAFEHTYGLHGVVRFMTPGKDFVEMSPITINEIKHLQQMVIGQGGRFLDCPFFGGLKEAETASVVFCASGDRSLYLDLTPCFKLLGLRSVFNTDVGSGSSLKTTLNMITGTFTASLAEALSMAKRLRIDPKMVMEVLKMIGISTKFLEDKAKKILEGERDNNFTIRMQQTEMRLAIDIADANNSSLPITTAVNELLKRAKVLGYGSKDMTSIFRAINE